MRFRVREEVGAYRQAAVALPIAIALLASGCGGEDGEEPQPLAVAVQSSGEITAPASTAAGAAEITVDNRSDRPAEVQLVRVEGDRTAAEVVRGVSATVQGEAMPDWLIPAGGVGPTAPGATADVTQVMEPGTYYLLDTTAGLPDPESVPVLEVTGGESAESLPEVDATVTASDYAFSTENLAPGENRVLFENTGEQPHHLVAMPIASGRTIEDVEESLRTEEGPPPLDDTREVSTTVIEGGERQLISLDLDRGKYALLCFIADRQGGPPHVAKGMIDEVVIGG